MYICRLCLNEDSKGLIPILMNEDIVGKIRECVSIEITEDDGLPLAACSICMQKVEDWWNFKQICLKSRDVLLQWNQTKTEYNNCDIKDVPTPIQIKFDAPENLYVCDICNKQFTTCLEHLDHQSLHNGTPVFKCDKCEQVLSTRADLVKHERSHKSPCPTCGKMLLQSSMNLHLIKHTDKFKCLRCHSHFNCKTSLQQHNIAVHTNQKEHICDTCGKSFSSKSAVNTHMRSHSDERSYKCKICNYGGRTASALYAHMTSHAEGSWVCEICFKIFKSSRHLNGHKKGVHTTEKKYQCPFCDKHFVNKYKLTIHVRSHTGVRPYGCVHCSKTFTRSDSLKGHLLVHTGAQEYPCHKCDKKFNTKKGLTRHNCVS